MATQTATPETPKRKRVKLAVFPVPNSEALDRLVTEGKLRRVEIPAKPERVTESGKKRKAQPARTEFISETRAGVLALYGGNEKAANVAACLYWPTYVKRMNSKGRVADPLRAINRTSETFAKMDESVLNSIPEKDRAAALEAIRTLQSIAKANPVAPRTRKTKKASS